MPPISPQSARSSGRSRWDNCIQNIESGAPRGCSKTIHRWWCIRRSSADNPLPHTGRSMDGAGSVPDNPVQARSKGYRASAATTS